MVIYFSGFRRNADGIFHRLSFRTIIFIVYSLVSKHFVDVRWLWHLWADSLRCDNHADWIIQKGIYFFYLTLTNFFVLKFNGLVVPLLACKSSASFHCRTVAHFLFKVPFIIHRVPWLFRPRDLNNYNRCINIKYTYNNATFANLLIWLIVYFYCTIFGNFDFNLLSLPGYLLYNIYLNVRTVLAKIFY